MRLSVVSSLFPQLSGRSRGPLRVAFALAVAILLIVAVAGLQAPVIAVSALAIPLLFLVYVYEIDPLELRFALPTTVIFLAGAALGVGWGLLLGPLAAGSLLPAYSPALLTGGVLVSAVAVPVAGQLLMVAARRGGCGCGGRTAARPSTASPPGRRARWASPWPPRSPSWRRCCAPGNMIPGSSVMAVVTQAVVRGISVPLVAAATTGYAGAALWARRGHGSAAGGLWLTSPWVALAFGLALAAGLGFADDAGLPDVALLAVHLAAAAAALLVLRAGLHHVLLHERPDLRPGHPARARTASAWCPPRRSARCAGSPGERPRSTRCRWPAAAGPAEIRPPPPAISATGMCSPR